MAVPTTAANLVHSGNPTTSATVTLGTTQADDIILIAAVNAGATAALTTTTGTFTESLTATGLAAAMTASWGGSWWARCTGDHTGQTIIFSGATDSISVCGHLIRGAENSGSPLGANTSSNTITANGLDLAAFTTTRADSLIIYMAAADDNIGMSAVTMGGGGMTLIQAASTGGSDSVVGVARANKATVGSTGAFAGTHASTLSKRLMAVEVMSPAPAVTPPAKNLSALGVG